MKLHDERMIEDIEKVDVYSFGVVLFYILSGGKMPKIKVSQIMNRKKAPIPNSFTQLTKSIINDY